MNRSTPNKSEKEFTRNTVFNWIFDLTTSVLNFSDNIDNQLLNSNLNVNAEDSGFFYKPELENFIKQCNSIQDDSTHPVQASLRIINTKEPDLCLNLTGYLGADYKIIGVGLLTTCSKQELSKKVEIMPQISPDKIPVIVCLTDTEGIIQYVNETLSKTTGYKAEELFHQHTRIFNSGAQCKEFYKKMWSTLKSGKTWEGKMLNKTKNGTIYWERAIISPYYNNQGHHIGYIKAAEDITQQVQAQKLLKEERNLFLSGPVIIFKWKATENWPVTYVSPNIRNILGYTPENFVSGELQFIKLIHPDDVQRVIDEINSFHLNPEVTHYTQQYRLKTQNGEYRHFNDYTSIERDDYGKPLHFSGYLLDTTEFIETQKALQENELKYRDVFQTAGVGIIYTNKQGQILDTNKKFDDLVKAEPGELKGCLAMDLINRRLPKSSSKKLLPVLFHILKGNKIEPLEIELGDGFYEIQSDYNPQLERNIGILRDITDKKIAEKKVHQSESKYKYLIDNMTEGLVITDVHENLTFINDAAKKILEIDDISEIKSIKDIATHASVDIIVQQEKLREIGATSEYFIEIITKKNNRKQLEIKATPIKDENDNYKGSFGLLRDITEQYKAELDLKSAYSQLKTINKKLQQHAEELEIAKKQAEEGERLKSAFLANISHEIRTPMNGIVGFAQLCMNTGLSDEKRKTYLQIISDSTLQLESVVMDIIDLSKIESGEAKLNYKEFELSENLKNLHIESFEKAKDKNLTLKWLIPNNIDLIYSDPIRFRQIVRILIDNAIKFTNEGSLIVKACIDNTHLTIAIKDTGIGIAEDMHEAIFEPFRQVEMAMKRKFGGTGLGLSIARKLARMLNGDIFLKSEPGQGSTFYFKHPHANQF